MKKKLIIVGALGLVGAIVAIVVILFALGKPLYTPGSVRAGNLATPLRPPAQDDAKAGFLRVTEAVSLFSFTEGEGQSVVIVHGGPGQPPVEPWAGLAPLADRYRFVYYHQRGCGRSTRPIDRFDAETGYLDNVETLNRTLGLGAQVADLERIRRVLGEEKLILIGHSFGGFMASLYAAEFPERVRALILVSPADVMVWPSEFGGLFEQMRPHLSEKMAKDFDAYLARYLDYGSIFEKSEAELIKLNAELIPFYVAAVKKKGLEVPVPAPPENGDEAADLGGGWMVHAMFFSMGLRHDFTPGLKAIEAPVLVIHGEKDLQPKGASAAYASYFPNAKLVELPGVGHFSFVEAPAAFAELVGEHLATAP